jgi:hypothetical protein
MRRRRLTISLLFWIVGGLTGAATTGRCEESLELDADVILGTRKVLQAIIAAARSCETGTALEGQPPGRRAIADLLVRRAAQTAGSLTPDVGPRALLLALGVALDTEGALRSHASYTRLMKILETEAERRARPRLLRRITIRNRHDIAQHFFISGLLAALHSPSVAESAGLAKELLDARGGSGFSFADLAADLAGVAFATRVLDGRITPERLARGFTGESFVPDLSGLAEGMPWQDFVTRFGSPWDPRYRVQLRHIRGRIERLPGFVAGEGTPLEDSLP